MLVVDYYERIGELVAKAVLQSDGVAIFSEETKIRVVIANVLGTHRGEAMILWPSATDTLEATVKALMRALEEL